MGAGSAIKRTAFSKHAFWSLRAARKQTSKRERNLKIAWDACESVSKNIRKSIKNYRKWLQNRPQNESLEGSGRLLEPPWLSEPYQTSFCCFWGSFLIPFWDQKWNKIVVFYNTFLRHLKKSIVSNSGSILTLWDPCWVTFWGHC